MGFCPILPACLGFFVDFNVTDVDDLSFSFLFSFAVYLYHLADGIFYSSTHYAAVPEQEGKITADASYIFPLLFLFIPCFSLCLSVLLHFIDKNHGCVSDQHFGAAVLMMTDPQEFSASSVCSMTFSSVFERRILWPLTCRRVSVLSRKQTDKMCSCTRSASLHSSTAFYSPLDDPCLSYFMGFAFDGREWNCCWPDKASERNLGGCDQFLTHVAHWFGCMFLSWHLSMISWHSCSVPWCRLSCTSGFFWETALVWTVDTCTSVQVSNCGSEDFARRCKPCVCSDSP